MSDNIRHFKMVTDEDSLHQMCRLIHSVGKVAVDTETSGLDPLTERLRLIQLCVEVEDELHCFVIDTWKWMEQWRLEPLALIFASEDILKIAHNAKFEIKFLTHHLLKPLDAGRCHAFFCTQLASIVVSAGNVAHHHSLADVVQRYLGGERMDKTLQKSDWSAEELSQEQIEYAANDVYVLGDLHHVLCKELLAKDLWRTTLIEMDAVVPIAEMELNGLPVKREQWLELLVTKEATRDALREQVVAMLQSGVDWLDRNPEKVGTRPVKPKKQVKKPLKKSYASTLEYEVAMNGYAAYLEEFAQEMAQWQERFDKWAALPDEVVPVINLNSPQQVRLAFINLQVPLGDRKTNEKHLQEVMNELTQELLKVEAEVVKARAENEAEPSAATAKMLSNKEQRRDKLKHWMTIINTLLEYRGAEKSVTSYGMNLVEKLSDEDRLHPDFNQIGAETGRMSCRDPNVQQIPKDEAHRSCIAPQPGRVFCIADYAQIELRILAQFSGDPNFVADFRSGKDMHKLGAARFFRKAYDEITKGERDKSKAINFLTVYGGGAYTLANRLKCPVEEAEMLLGEYFGAYTGNERLMKKASEQAMRRGFARTMTGRLALFDIQRAKFGDNWKLLKAYGRNGINMPIQGTSADMIKRAQYLLGNRLAGTDAMMVNVVHDEILVECDNTPNAIERASAALKECMEAAGREFLTLVGCPVDVLVADRWVKE